jgi:hypothetical protein
MIPAHPALFVFHSTAFLFVVPQRFCLSFRSEAEESAVA